MTVDERGGPLLVVDDEAAVLRGTTRILERAGYRCLTASGPDEAMELLAAQSFDLVLTDIDMPGRSGLWLVERVMSEHPDTAAVMVTGMDDPRVAAQALDLGAYGYVIKPFEANELVITVTNALTRRRLEIDNRGHLRRLEGLLADSERSYRVLFDANPQPMWVYDQASLSFLAVNDAAVVQYGYSRDELLGMTVADIRPAEDGPALRLSIGEARSFDRSGPWHHIKKDGTVIDVEITSHTLVFDGRPARFAMASDITERRAYETQLRNLAVYDGLTGLANRTMVLDRLERALSRATRSAGTIAVLLVDVDRFKVVNDAHGQDVGDDVLQEIGRRLTDAVGDAGTLGRLAADEYAIICEGVIDSEDAGATAERIMRALAEPFAVPAGEAFLTASVGIALSGPRSSPEVLMRDASSAMHRAKDLGGARQELFDERIRRQSLAKLQREGDLRRAIDAGELRLHYQPELDLRTGTCVGVEALMRWEHPTLGLLPPSEFIPLAEETGLIVRLGRWALHEACGQAARWRDAGVHVGTVSVNLSARQLQEPDLVTDVCAALTGAQLDPSALCVELTETMLMDDSDAGLTILEELRRIGVRSSIDDFGTGYSSLLYLQRFPVDMLKVDRTFVARVVEDDRNEAIVSAVIGLGHAFGLLVVAEGIETPEQAAVLRRMGCDIGQGYLWSRPVPPDELVEALAHGQLVSV
ncbi:MAG TPA: EAL domain-containing protein [Acidimicrobiales bacterium]